MTCTRCSAQNQEGAKFCIECGNALGRACSGCGGAVPDAAKFCPECGVDLRAVEPSRTAVVSHAERRQLTVMFCDLVGSTELSELLDPEDLHEVLRVYQRTVTKEIERFDGSVAKFLGDGMLIFFGFPLAHEDDAVRAVNAGLAVTQAIAALGKLSVRIGIHTGLVVAGEMGPDGKMLADIVGETPNIAARLQGEAGPGEVVITQATARLLAGRFRCESLGERELKGVSRKIEILKVLGAFLGSAPDLSSRPFLGRELELSQMVERWTRAEGGAGQAVLLCGEPGIGKSSLARALSRHVGKARFIEVKCSVYQQNSPFHPVIELLEDNALQFRHEDSIEQKVEKLEAYVDQMEMARAEILPILGSLLSVPLPAQYPPLALSAEGLRQKTLELLLRIVLTRASKEPVLLVVEDVHWADPSTLQLLNLIITQSVNSRLLTVVTFRPTYTPTFGAKPHVLYLTLDRLNSAMSAELVEATAGHPIPASVSDRILSMTDGVPLFVEELTKMVVESGHLVLTGERFESEGPLPDMAIPTTLHDSLMARLDRLSSVKEIAQVASVIGREFTADLLGIVSGLDRAELFHGTTKLLKAELFDEFFSSQGATTFRFRHALIQDAAYKSLLKSRRIEIHGRIADVLQAHFPSLVEGQPELLASHLTSANRSEEALRQWIAAGTRANARSAHHEAIVHFGRALELLPQIADPVLCIQFEIAIQASLGVALISSRGFAAPEVEQTYARANDLCEMAGDAPELFPVRWGIWVVHLVRAEYEAAQAQAETLLRTAMLSQNDSQLVEAHFTLGDTLYWRGSLTEAHDQLYQALGLYQMEKHSPNALIYGQDVGVATHCYLSLTLSQLGDVAKALKHAGEALSLARKIGHPFSLSYALGCNTLLRLWMRDVPSALLLGDETVANCTEQGHAFFATSGVFMRGWGIFHGRDKVEGLADMRAGLAAFDMTGSRVAQPLFHALLAEAFIQSGQTEEAEKTIERGYSILREGGEAVSLPDLHHAQMRLLIAQGKDASAAYDQLEDSLTAIGAQRPGLAI